ncbi:probable G-protein coupled receptor No18 [Antedon mediterranea]|uniref:probable G-protein coupled receptor No18 n=1 Tax=Antedon mediterranea TaxID=105859 RepID=UPI003AF5B88A
MEFDENASTSDVSDEFEVTAGLILTHILVSILSIIAIGGNALTIIVFTRNATLRNNPQSNRHIMSLATADLGVGLIPLPLLIVVTTLDRWPFGVVMCMLKSIIEGSFLIVTIYTIAFISLDRYLLVHKEYPVYLEAQTKRKVNMQISFTWVFSIVTMTTNEIVYYEVVGFNDTTADDLYCNFHTIPETLSNLFLLFILLFVPMSVIAYFNLNTFLNIRKRILRRRRVGIMDDGASATVNTVAVNPSKNDRAQNADDMSSKFPNVHRPTDKNKSSTHVDFKRRYIKPAIMMGVILSTFLVCWAPLGITGVMKNFTMVFEDRRHWKWIHLIMYADSVFNPILYAITNKKVRIAMVKCIKWK